VRYLTKTLMIATTLGLAGLGGVPLGVAAELTAPKLVAASLERFAHDDADMVRRVDAKAYDRLAKEEEDFAKDAELLRAAIHGEPATFQLTVEASIQRVLTASHDVTAAGRTPIDGDLRRALDALAEAVRQLNSNFPEALRSTSR